MKRLKINVKINLSSEHISAIDSFETAEGLTPKKFQKQGIAFLMCKKYALLGDDMGIGKTMQALIAAWTLKLDRVLVICPNSVCLSWQREASKWIGLNGMGDYFFPILYSKKVDKSSAWNILPWSQVALQRERLLVKWDLVIIDEAHYAKTPTTQRTVAVFGRDSILQKRRKPVAAICDNAKRIWCLTGTPIPNRPIEIQPILKALSVSFARNYYNYGNRYCRRFNQWTASGYDYKGAQREAELGERLRDSVLLRRLKVDVMTELPPITRQVIPMETTDKLLKANIKKQLQLIADKAGWNINNVVGKGWAPDLEEISEMRHEEALLKMPAVVEFVIDTLDAAPDKKIVVFAYHRDVIEGIHKALFDKEIQSYYAHGGQSPEKRQELIDTFVESLVTKVFIASIPACGTGMNGLQEASSHCMFAEMVWTPAELSQPEGRLDRMGQTEPVLSQYLVMRGGLDAYMINTVFEKMNTLQEILG